MEQEKQRTLVDTMTSAKTKEEITEAQREAELWLEQNPADTDVAVAKQTLDEKAEKLDDPEHKANKATWVTLALAIPLAVVVSLMFSVSWGAAVVIGVYVGMEIAWWVWELVGAGAESRSERGQSTRDR
jgi:hypothetical protein